MYKLRRQGTPREPKRPNIKSPKPKTPARGHLFFFRPTSRYTTPTGTTVRIGTNSKPEGKQLRKQDTRQLVHKDGCAGKSDGKKNAENNARRVVTQGSRWTNVGEKASVHPPVRRKICQNTPQPLLPLPSNAKNGRLSTQNAFTLRSGPGPPQCQDEAVRTAVATATLKLPFPPHPFLSHETNHETRITQLPPSTQFTFARAQKTRSTT